jgi:hypothetical protein
MLYRRWAVVHRGEIEEGLRLARDGLAAWERGGVGAFLQQGRFGCPIASQFMSKSRLEAENAALRHQLIVLGRRPRGRVLLANPDRWFFVRINGFLES